jgi:hypothetical protein
MIELRINCIMFGLVLCAEFGVELYQPGRLHGLGQYYEQYNYCGHYDYDRYRIHFAFPAFIV